MEQEPINLKDVVTTLQIAYCPYCDVELNTYESILLDYVFKCPVCERTW